MKHRTPSPEKSPPRRAARRREPLNLEQLYPADDAQRFFTEAYCAYQVANSNEARAPHSLYLLTLLCDYYGHREERRLTEIESSLVHMTACVLGGGDTATASIAQIGTWWSSYMARLAEQHIVARTAEVLFKDVRHE